MEINEIGFHPSKEVSEGNTQKYVFLRSRVSIPLRKFRKAESDDPSVFNLWLFPSL